MARDEVRLLGRRAGYTSDPARALPGEPEAVDRDTQQRITLAAARDWPHLDALQRGERASKPIVTRLRRIEAQARLTGIDVRPQLHTARLKIEQGRHPAHVERYVTALENRVFPRRV